MDDIKTLTATRDALLARQAKIDAYLAELNALEGHSGKKLASLFDRFLIDYAKAGFLLGGVDTAFRITLKHGLFSLMMPLNGQDPVKMILGTGSKLLTKAVEKAEANSSKIHGIAEKIANITGSDAEKLSATAQKALDKTNSVLHQTDVSHAMDNAAFGNIVTGVTNGCLIQGAQWLVASLVASPSLVKGLMRAQRGGGFLRHFFGNQQIATARLVEQHLNLLAETTAPDAKKAKAAQNRVANLRDFTDLTIKDLSTDLRDSLISAGVSLNSFLEHQLHVTEIEKPTGDFYKIGFLDRKKTIEKFNQDLKNKLDKLPVGTPDGLNYYDWKMSNYAFSHEETLGAKGRLALASMINLVVGLQVTFYSGGTLLLPWIAISEPIIAAIAIIPTHLTNRRIMAKHSRDGIVAEDSAVHHVVLKIPKISLNMTTRQQDLIHQAKIEVATAAFPAKLQDAAAKNRAALKMVTAKIAEIAAPVNPHPLPYDSVTLEYLKKFIEHDAAYAASLNELSDLYRQTLDATAKEPVLPVQQILRDSGRIGFILGAGMAGIGVSTLIIGPDNTLELSRQIAPYLPDMSGIMQPAINMVVESAKHLPLSPAQLASLTLTATKFGTSLPDYTVGAIQTAATLALTVIANGARISSLGKLMKSTNWLQQAIAPVLETPEQVVDYARLSTWQNARILREDMAKSHAYRIAFATELSRDSGDKALLERLPVETQQAIESLAQSGNSIDYDAAAFDDGQKRLNSSLLHEKTTLANLRQQVMQDWAIQYAPELLGKPPLPNLETEKLPELIKNPTTKGLIQN